MQKYLLHILLRVATRRGRSTLATCCLETGHGFWINHEKLLRQQHEGCGSSPSWKEKSQAGSRS